VLDAAVAFNPEPAVQIPGQPGLRVLQFYSERRLAENWSFWQRPSILNRDIFASLYNYAESVIDIKACLDSELMSQLMLRTWYDFQSDLAMIRD